MIMRCGGYPSEVIPGNPVSHLTLAAVVRAIEASDQLVPFRTNVSPIGDIPNEALPRPDAAFSPQAIY
jgi:hypothetical protein